MPPKSAEVLASLTSQASRLSRHPGALPASWCSTEALLCLECFLILSSWQALLHSGCHRLWETFPKSPDVGLSPLPPSGAHADLLWLLLHHLLMIKTTDITLPPYWTPKIYFVFWILPLNKDNATSSSERARHGESSMCHTEKHVTYQALIMNQDRSQASC